VGDIPEPIADFVERAIRGGQDGSMHGRRRKEVSAIGLYQDAREYPDVQFSPTDPWVRIR
jgi:hypothetical protein